MASLPLLPDSNPGPKLVGIARIAAEGESLREGHNVEYFTLASRSLLNRVVSRRELPFTWAVNPYRGCEFACKYCYARYTHEFMELREGIDFERKIFIKQHAADLLRQELRRVKSGEGIAIGTATDPYQPADCFLLSSVESRHWDCDQVKHGYPRCGDSTEDRRKQSALRQPHGDNDRH
jgi:hypothetical protein